MDEDSARVEIAVKDLTRRRNDLRRLISSEISSIDNNFKEEMNTMMCKMEESWDRYQCIHTQVLRNVRDDVEIEEEYVRYDEQKQLTTNLRKRLAQWMKEDIRLKTQYTEFEVSSETSCQDSVSGLQTRSKASCSDDDNSELSTTLTNERLEKARALKEEVENKIKILENKQRKAKERKSSRRETVNTCIQPDPPLNDDVNIGKCEHSPAAVPPPSNTLQDILSSQMKCMEKMMEGQMQSTLLLTLPKPEMPVFSGNPVEFHAFMKAFENLIADKTDNCSTKLYFLIQYTRGEVQDLMKSCLSKHPNDGYAEAILLLKKRFGQNYKIATAYVDKVTSWPTIKTEDGINLQRFADLLTSCTNTLNEIGYISKLDNTDCLKRIISKLPYDIRKKWRNKADYITEFQDREITIIDVTEFVSREARIVTHPVFGNVQNTVIPPDSDKHKTRLRGGNFSRTNFLTKLEEERTDKTEQDTRSRSFPKCPCCKDDHTLVECDKFKKMNIDDKRRFVQESRLCFNCLTYGHRAGFCRKRINCDICKGHHATILHQQNPIPQATCCFTNGGKLKSSKIGQPFIFGKIRNGGKLLPAIGLYDSGSNGTFVTSTALSKVGITGKSTELGLTTLCKENDSVNSLVTDLEFLSQDEDHLAVLNSVYSLPSLPISTADIPTQEDIDSWPHLKGITVPKLVPGQEVDLLIGNDNSVIFEPLEIRHSQNNGPFAVRTKFGWLINGPFGKNVSQQRTCNFIRKDVELNQQFEQFCNYEFNDSIDDTQVTMSREDSKALSVFEQSINLVDGHYEVSLPWKHDQLQLPNPRIMAEHRLMLLKRRFMKDAALFEKYSEIINELLSKKYAEVVPPGHIDRADDRVWYLPHHPVVNTKKPGKLRVVFDCAAKFKGVALNDVLLKGPDLTSSLVGVLLRFRQGYYALMGDVESMFHQVNVPQDERDVFRFLWWQSNDVNGELIELRMRVHLFGATSSPSVCNFTLRRTAEDNCEAFDSEVVETVQKNFYVDDCLKSLDDENEAISLVDNLRKLLLKGGFNLTKWVSNSRNIIKSISETERAKTVKNLNLDGLPIERALGVLWDTESDCFTFNVVLKEKPISRRGILSILSSVYDPLGFVAPFVLNAKLILQELCRLKLGWDSKIPDEYEKLWLSWMEDLPLLSSLQVSRCLKPPPSCARVVSVQLHCFSDASQQGYGAVSYLRFIDDAGNVCCSFVTGKSRVSPLKSISIPRLELSAAVVSVRLNKIITRELQMKIDKSFYWTDSTSVLKYVNNQDKRFHTFVGNRISTILDGSQPSQWKYVESARNPADEASRGVAAKTILGGSKWISGPDFLWKDELEWPSQPHEYVIQDTDPEVRIEKHSRFVIKGDNSLLDQLVKRFSSWYKLKRCVAWILRYREILKARCQGNQAARDVKQLQEPSRLTVVELTAAETEILKLVHKTSFPEEYAVLSKKDENGHVSRKSPIFKLDPVLIGGLIRVGGRLRRHNGLFDTKHQIILPKRNPVTELVIRHYHEMLAHSGREYCLSSIRRRFWPINGNSAVRRVLSDCYNCRRRNAPVCNQRMADLPKERVTPDLPPFSYIGIDCFGPFFVKRARSQLKRYGCIFTCLSCRAVHLEVLHSMDTDSFLNAFRRFICRRGSPLKIRSDNGGNFVAGSKEIKGSVEEWNRKQVDDFMLQREIEWCFNPPAGSHFGGIWERCIRSVRKILDSLLNEQVLCDESLNTLFCEVEMIINGRPLTKVSDDPKDQEALTPNHLMLLRAAGSYPPGLFVERDLYVRNRWRQVQYLANVFWRRWTREYLPLLQVRQKWNEKQRNLVIGDVILLADKDQPRGSWPLGRVVEVYPDDQGTVRVVKLLTKDCKSLCRPVDKCVLLENASD